MTSTSPLNSPAVAAPSTDFAAALTRTRRLSRYVHRLLETEPALADELRQGHDTPWSAEAMTAYLAAASIDDEISLQAALRKLRKRIMLRTVFRDLTGLADLREVIMTMTALAELTLRTAMTHEHRWLAGSVGEPIGEETNSAQQMLVIGMGKLGGTELNVSSDIDLIFVYPEDGETRPVASDGGKRPIGNHEFFTRLGRRVIAALNDITADGFVFRVDMRLRPYGDSGALVVSFAMLENYLITQARAWERYAWIKGRLICGDRGPELEALRQPFVFRKYLDYGALGELRDLHKQIRAEARRRDALANIKIGPGGIREIEFIVQAFQLIRGGRERALQALATLDVLRLLAERGLLPAVAAEELAAAYRFLRNLEHRLQYLDDEQTQRLPDKPADRQLIAEAMQFANYPALLAALDKHRERVTEHFEAVFAADMVEPSVSDDETTYLVDGKLRGEAPEESTTLMALGYGDGESLQRRLAQMRKGNHYLGLPEKNRARLDALIPRVIETAARFTPPDATLTRMLDLLEAVDRRESYLALLTEYPPVLERIARLTSVSPWAADYLRRHPILLDELLDTNSLLAPPHWRKLANALQIELDHHAGDTERQMDLLRHFKQAQLFRLLAQDLDGLMTVERLSDHLSELADRILAEVLRLCWQRVAGADAAPPKVAVIGYGKLGGKELGYASDLDIIFLYADQAGEERERYARLAQRVVSWLNTLTSAGVLYESDLRLRPDGEKGLLTTSVGGFLEYQKKHAWVWEHQALTRARYCVGDAAVGEAFEDIRVDILTAARDRDALRQDVLAMRNRMRANKPVPHGVFDLKHSPGGIVDVEFIVQFLVLAHAHRYWELTRNSGTIALLRTAADLKLVPHDLAYATADAYRELRRLQHLSRLNDERNARLPAEATLGLSEAPLRLWQQLFG